MNRKKYYTYPVLSPVNSGYNELCEFTMLCDTPYAEDKELIIPYMVRLKSKLLNDLLENGKAKLWLTVSSLYTSKMIEYCVNDKVLKIDTNKLVNQDVIDVCLEVIAVKDFTICNNGEFSSRYGGDYECDVHKGDVLAETNECEIEFNRGSSSIFVWKPLEEDESGVSFQFDEAVIKICGGKKLISSLETLKLDAEKKGLYDAYKKMIILQAITASLLLISERFEEFGEARWQIEYDHICRKNYEKSIKEILENYKDEKENMHELSQLLFKELMKDKKGIDETIIELASKE